MKFRMLAYYLLCTTLLTCDEDSHDVISTVAENFLNEIMQVMEEHSINKNTIDWTDFKNKVLNSVPTAQSIEDTYPGIRVALTMLGDNHSSFIKPEGGVIFTGTFHCIMHPVVVPTLPPNIGYVKITSFSGSNGQAIAFANSIKEQIESQDHAGISGWIVDLRGNGGGNMWPMVAGIGPILGAGVAGYFIDPDGLETSWSFQNGASYLGSTIITQVNDPYELVAPNPKVAVLLDNGIASSGEVIAISFIGRANSKSFGTATCGLSTGNSSFDLSHGARLILTTAHVADRHKHKYGVPISPDQTSTHETIVQDARNWIEH